MRRAGYASYCGREECRSIGAINSEENGRLPLTRAIPVVAQRAGCTQKQARAALLATHDGEWHHTGNRAMRTNYYDIDAAVAATDTPAGRALAAEQLDAERIARIEAFRRHLINNRDCSRRIHGKGRDTTGAWLRYANSIGLTDYMIRHYFIRPGDDLQAALAAARHDAMMDGQLDAMQAAVVARRGMPLDTMRGWARSAISELRRSSGISYGPSSPEIQCLQDECEAWFGACLAADRAKARAANEAIEEINRLRRARVWLRLIKTN